MYMLNIIAVEIYLNEPTLIAGDSNMSHEAKPALSKPSAQLVAAWLAVNAPKCFVPDISGIQSSINGRIESALFGGLKKATTVWLRLPAAGYVVWICVESA